VKEQTVLLVGTTAVAKPPHAYQGETKGREKRQALSFAQATFRQSWAPGLRLLGWSCAGSTELLSQLPAKLVSAAAGPPSTTSDM